MPCLSTTCTLVPAGGAVQQLYSWGKLKTNGDSQMYPVPHQDMTGAFHEDRRKVCVKARVSGASGC